MNETENVAAASRLQKLETEQRQRLIDRLMEELDNRTNAVKKIGADLYQAREINHALEV